MFHTDGVPATEATEDGGFPTPDKWECPGHLEQLLRMSLL